jgi:hypothetical protein
MRKSLPIAVIAFMALLGGTAMASIIGDAGAVNVTIYDGQSSGTGWYGPQENNETEPGTITAQAWDFEAFFWNGSTRTLYLVGGYDFINGYSDTTAGDVFLYSGGTGYFLDLDRVASGNLDAVMVDRVLTTFGKSRTALLIGLGSLSRRPLTRDWIQTVPIRMPTIHR